MIQSQSNDIGVVVKPAGSGQIDFAHATERLEYWTRILELTKTDHFKEWNDFMEIKATGCIEEWQYIRHVLCPNHHMDEVNASNKYRHLRCPVCGYVQFINPNIS